MRSLSIAAVIALQPLILPAQSPDTPTWASHLKGKRILDSAVAAIGGLEALRKATTVTRELGGIRTDVGQGPRPVFLQPTYSELGPIPPKVNAPRITAIRDYGGRRAYDRLRDTIYGGSLIDVATVVAPPARFTIHYDYTTD